MTARFSWSSHTRGHRPRLQVSIRYEHDIHPVIAGLVALVRKDSCRSVQEDSVRTIEAILQSVQGSVIESRVLEVIYGGNVGTDAVVRSNVGCVRRDWNGIGENELLPSAGRS